MSMTIKGAGTVTLSGTVPAHIVASSFPYFHATIDAENRVMRLIVSPYVEVYSEYDIRSFLRSLGPYITSGEINISLMISKNHVIKWSFNYSGNHWTRKCNIGSCAVFEHIDD